MNAEAQITEPTLNATPLIDVLLVLLVLLIMTVPIATHAVKLNLPHGAPGVPPPTVRLEILYGGDILWNGEFIATIDELLPRLAGIAGSESPVLLKVLPDKRAPYARVAQVLAAAQRSHVGRLTVSPVPDR